MSLDIRKKEKNVSFKQLWLKDIYEKIQLDPDLKDVTPEVIKKTLLEEFEKRKILNGRLYNNATSENQIMTQEQFINMYLNEPLILSGYACLFKNQDNSINISSAALENLGDMRKFYKKKMEAAEHGSDDYIYYRILQLTYKVLMNSYYGILGQKNSVFYNPFVQNSITLTGQDLITTSIIGMEAFLKNNVPFSDTDDILTYLNNVITEESKFNILDYLDEPISKKELINYLVHHIHKESKEIDVSLITSIVNGMTSEKISRAFYKNKLLELFKENWFKNQLNEILNNLKDEAKIKGFVDIVVDLVQYNYLFEDRYKRAVNDKRQAVITIDTDSVFCNVNEHVVYIRKLLNLQTDSDNDITNVIIKITTEALENIFWKLTTNMGLIDRTKPIINMKQEFCYQRIMLTRNKKSYGGIITAELGHPLKVPVLDIKGLSIRKTTVSKKLRQEFTEILEEDILKAPSINLKTILNKYDNIGDGIQSSLQTGSVEYLIPKNLELIESYKTPDQIEAVRAAIIWNAVEPESTIVPPEKISMTKLRPELFEPISQIANVENLENLIESVKCGVDHPELSSELKELIVKHTDKFLALAKIIYGIGNTNKSSIDISRFGLSCIAIPKSLDKIPEYLIPFIDYSTMVNNNMTNGYILLESLSVYVEEVKTTKYKSNIIQI